MTSIMSAGKIQSTMCLKTIQVHNPTVRNLLLSYSALWIPAKRMMTSFVKHHGQTFYQGSKSYISMRMYGSSNGPRFNIIFFCNTILYYLALQLKSCTTYTIIAAAVPLKYSQNPEKRCHLLFY